MSANERLLDFQVAQAVRWLRYSNGQQREVNSILKGIDRRITRLLNSDRYKDAPYSKKRAEALRKQLREIMDEVHRMAGKHVRKMAEGVAQTSADTEIKAWERVLPAGLDAVTPNPGIIATMLDKPYNGGYLEDWLDQMKEGDFQRTWFKIRDGMVAGQTTDEIVRDVVGSKSLKYKDGVREVSRRGAATLVRTAVNHSANAGRQAAWAANSDLIQGVRWVSTLDSRTSPICRDRDGELYPVDSGPRPPAHPNCRSTTVAVLKSAEELGLKNAPAGTRASMNGQVPAKTTYYQWLERQSPELQKEVLGAKRYTMWKDGKYEPKQFHDDSGRLFTLDELKRRSPPVRSPGSAPALAAGPMTAGTYEATYRTAFSGAPAYAQAAAAKAKPNWQTTGSAKGAYYSSAGHTLYMANGYGTGAAEAVMRHEMGHAIDFRGTGSTLSGDMTKGALSDWTRLETKVGLFEKEARDLVMDEKMVPGGVPNPAAIATKYKLTAEEAHMVTTLAGKDVANRSNVILMYRTADPSIVSSVASPMFTNTVLGKEWLMFSDLIEAVTQAKYGMGHGADYYKRFSTLTNDYTVGHMTEAYANWFALTSSPNARHWKRLLEAYIPDFARLAEHATRKFAE